MDVARALARRIRMLVARGVVQLVDDSLKVQGMQLTLFAGEVAQVQRFQEYGFTSVPFEGAEAIAAAVAGVRSHLVVLAVDDGRYRKKDLQPGEVALYTDEGDYLHFKRGKIVEIYSGGVVNIVAPEVDVSASTKCNIDTPELHCTGKITADDDISTSGAINADGDITSTSDVKAGAISLTQHIHQAPEGPTGPAEAA